MGFQAVRLDLILVHYFSIKTAVMIVYFFINLTLDKKKYLGKRRKLGNGYCSCSSMQAHPLKNPACCMAQLV